MDYKQHILFSQKELKILENTKNYIITKAKFGPSKPTIIPLNLTEELAFFAATIMGDGHLKKRKFQTSIELSNKRLIDYIQKICKQIFNRDFNINPVKLREGKKQSWQIPLDSKSIHSLLNKVFEIPIGKKSHLIKVPKYIKKASNSIKSAFLIGIMVTEGGKRHGKGRYGLSTASQQLWLDLIELFRDLDIKLRTDKWIYKKYKKEYYGLSFKREDLFSLTGRCRSGQTGQILETCFKETKLRT